ncbi:MAG TPA: anti-sigma factor [Beijerinckiaceae bacterium]|nr:anti-sigma factor [Beijerinckiaceae bacterium]
MTEAHELPTDAELTAFLDGELPNDRRAAVERRLQQDSLARERLALLERGARPFQAAFDVILDAAPNERLKAMLSKLPSAPASVRRRSRLSRIVSAAAAALALFGVGLAAGHWVYPRSASEGRPRTEAEGTAPENWRQTVAEYFRLQSPATLAAIPDDARTRRAELAAAASRLGLALSQGRLALPDLVLKRAELFVFKGMPLAEILYFDPQGGPMALCIIANGKPDAGLRSERREGMNVVYWQQKKRGFLLIGRTRSALLRQRAKTIAGRLSP